MWSKTPVYVAGLERGVRPMGDWSMSMTLSSSSRALDAVVVAGARLGAAVQARRHPLEDDLVDERGLAGPGHAGHAAERAEREAHVDVLQVVHARAPDGEPLERQAALAGDGDAAAAGEEVAGQRAGRRHDLGRRALGDHLAAVLAGPGTHVDDVVGRAHRLFVVLDDDHGVAEVAQAQQGVDEAAVVALVQADAGLVEDVEHADEGRADLRRQADALRLAAGERRRGALQRQVPDADVVEEGAGARRSP